MNDAGDIIARHLSDSFQDPSLAFLAVQGLQCTTTIVKGDDGFLCILALRESLRSMPQFDAKLHDMEGNRSVITIVTEGEKILALMGFRFEGEGPPHEQLAVEDDPGDEILLAPEDDVVGRS